MQDVKTETHVLTRGFDPKAISYQNHQEILERISVRPTSNPASTPPPQQKKTLLVITPPPPPQQKNTYNTEI